MNASHKPVGRTSEEPGACVRASEEERALYRELLQTYRDLYQLARGQEHDRLGAHVEKTEALLEQLRDVADVVGAVRTHMHAGAEPPGLLKEIWADTARSLAEIVPLRERVVEALRAAADETQETLVRIGVGQNAIGAYHGRRRSSRVMRSTRA